MVYMDSQGSKPPSLIERCSTGRLPPPLPSDVSWSLENVKKFTGKGDLPVVSELYRHFFEMVAPELKDFSAAGLSWAGDEARRLAQSLPHFTSLVWLDTRDNEITGDGAAELAEAVLAHPRIKTFNKYLPVQDMKADELTELTLKRFIGVDGLAALAGLLPSTQSLTSLDTSVYDLNHDYAKMTAACAAQLAAAVLAHPNITSFNRIPIQRGSPRITHSNGDRKEPPYLGDQPTMIVDSYLSLPRVDGQVDRVEQIWPPGALTSFYGELHAVKFEGVMVLAGLLPNSKNLLDLKLVGGWSMMSGADSILAFDEVIFEVFVALSAALKQCASLTQLNISRSSLGPRGTTTLASAISIMPSLKQLLLNGNGIGEGDDAGVNALAEALRISPSPLALCSLQGDHSLGHRARQMLTEAVSQRSGLQLLL